eukprot:scaffold24426_cov54-Attheya_sp.AAC.2
MSHPSNMRRQTLNNGSRKKDLPYAGRLSKLPFGSATKKKLSKRRFMFFFTLYAVMGMTLMALIVPRQMLGGSVDVDIDFPSISAFRPFDSAADRANTELSRRAKERRQRTRPPSSRRNRGGGLGQERSGGESELGYVEYLLPTDTSTEDISDETETEKADSQLLKKPSDLCGKHAQSAYEKHPHNYLAQDVLNEHSKVVITGVLNQLGFNLALALYNTCNVTHIFGIDDILPNTREHRIEMMDRYAILMKNIPQFQKLTVPFSGIHPHSTSGEEAHKADEFDVVHRFKPTHIIHLAAYAGRGDDMPFLGNTSGVSLYGENTQFQLLRQSMVSMEQLLWSLRKADSGDRKPPHFVHISTTQEGLHHSVQSIHSMYGVAKFINEALASAYQAIFGIVSVGIRLPYIYGPWGRRGSILFEMAERAVGNSSVDIIAPRDLPKLKDDFRFIYVDDVVDAFISSMQFRPVQSTVLSLAPDSPSSLLDMTEHMEVLFPRGEDSAGIEKHVIDKNTYNQDTKVKRWQTQDQIGWKPSTMLDDGVTKLLAWHFGRNHPFGPPLNENTPSHPNNLFGCMKETPDHNLPRRLPCASGCTTPELCTPSVFDKVIRVSKRATNSSCHFVAYMISLWSDDDHLPNAPALADDPSEDAKLCKVAFVANGSPLVQNAIKSEKSEHSDPLLSLNGKIQKNGWTLVWIDEDASFMNEDAYALLKLAPHTFFAPKVVKAMFIEANKIGAMSTDAILTMIKHAANPYMPEKTWWKPLPDGTKQKFVHPAEPARRSILFAPAFNFAPDFNPHMTSVTSVATVIAEQKRIKPSPSQSLQNRFYDHASHLVRSQELRSVYASDEEIEKIFPTQWIDSTWIIHELKLEESRQLRCEWYSEQAFWENSDMDDLSLAFVLAKRRVIGKHGFPTPGREEFTPLLVEPATQEDIVLGLATDKHATDQEGYQLYVRFAGEMKNKDANSQKEKSEEDSTTN